MGVADPKPRYRRRSKRQRQAAHRDAAFSAWLHTLPCCVCGRYGVEQHHYPYRSKAGWHDLSSLPLCAEHHRGKEGFHTLGAAKWQRLHGVDAAAVIGDLQRQWEAMK